MPAKDSKKIWTFIEEQTVLTLATSVNDRPRCCSCFFVLDKEKKILVFKSADNTKHVEDMNLQHKVAGSILPDLSSVGEIKGIQFTGEIVTVVNNQASKQLSGLYLKKFPYARLMRGTFWFIQLDYVKMTDNKLGIGKKLIWNNGS